MSLLLLFAGAGTGGTPPVPPVTAVVGWPTRRRRIPVEQLREILKAQGSPWALELADTYREAEKRLASPKSKKHKRVLEELLEEVSERAADTIDWGPIILSLQAALSATRTVAAIRHAEAALSTLQDDEEAIMMLMM